MKRNRQRKILYITDYLALVIFALLFICEVVYFGFFKNVNFKNSVDNLPYNIVEFIKSNFEFKYEHLIYKDNQVSIETGGVKNENNLLSERIIDKKLKFDEVDINYFNNALFIGDSRFVGFSIYNNFEGATYFCYQSASAFNILETLTDVEKYGKITLTDLLTAHRFDKIYLSLGVNSLATGIPNHRAHYKQVLDLIIDTQPQAIIYLMANMHVTDELQYDKMHVNNVNINLVNNFISSFADNKQSFYLDPNILYDDEFGNLNKDFTSDHAHVYVKDYDKYLYFLLTHALVEDKQD